MILPVSPEGVIASATRTRGSSAAPRITRSPHRGARLAFGRWSGDAITFASWSARRKCVASHDLTSLPLRGVRLSAVVKFARVCPHLRYLKLDSSWAVGNIPPKAVLPPREFTETPNPDGASPACKRKRRVESTSLAVRNRFGRNCREDSCGVAAYPTV